MTVIMWKISGGYMTTLKIRGRWYWVGASAADYENWRKRHPDVKVSRVGTPWAVRNVWNKWGNGLVAMRSHFPPIEDSPLP